MATLDTNQYQRNQPQAVHAGVNAALFHISLSVAVSAGDIHRIGKLPPLAIPLDAIFYPGSGGSGVAVYKFGTSISNDMFFFSATYSNTIVPYRCVRRLGLNQQNSLSDDAMPRYDSVTMVCTTGAVTGTVGDLIVYFKMPDQTL